MALRRATVNTRTALQVKDGAAGASFGLNVAIMAGLPPAVIARASAIAHSSSLATAAEAAGAQCARHGGHECTAVVDAGLAAEAFGAGTAAEGERGAGEAARAFMDAERAAERFVRVQVAGAAAVATAEERREAAALLARLPSS